MGIVISLPRAKSGTKASVVSTLITAIILTVMAIVFVLPIFGSQELEVTQKFYARSSLSFGGYYNYTCTVTGEVKNITSETLYDVEFYVTVENEDYYAECDAIIIEEIAPGEVVRVQGVFDSTRVYNDIESIEYSVNGGAKKSLSQGDEWIASIGLGVIALIMWIIFLVSLGQYKKKKNQVESQFGGNTFGGPVSTNDGHVMTNPFATNPQPTASTPQMAQAQTCPYCGSKVSATDGKCPGCGAKL